MEKKIELKQKYKDEIIMLWVGEVANKTWLTRATIYYLLKKWKNPNYRTKKSLAEFFNLEVGEVFSFIS
jgi:DNA-binding XRE family transcriptional regulator